MGMRTFGTRGMYACDHLIGNKSDTIISQQVVRSVSCVDVKRTCRSKAKICHVVIMFSISRHSNKCWNGRETQAMGKL